MKKEEKLYEILGELLYVVAMADGRIQLEEREALEKLFEGHPWAAEAIWSFEYELKKKRDVEDVYKKVINFCREYGPAPEYNEFIEAMNKIADSSAGIDEDEEKRISSFSSDLLTRFKEDTDILRKMK